MDSVDKAKIRLEHWISHNEHHSEDYEGFIKELEEAGKAEKRAFATIDELWHILAFKKEQRKNPGEGPE